MINKKITIISSIAISILLAIGLFFLSLSHTSAIISQKDIFSNNLGKVKELGNISNAIINDTSKDNLIKEFDKIYKSTLSYKSCVIDKMKQHENITIIYIYCDVSTAKFDKTKLSKDNKCQPEYTEQGINRCNISMKWMMGDAGYETIIKPK